MIIPDWLTALTGAKAFANNPANNYQATLGDALQGIGHDMMQHYRGQAGQPAPQPQTLPLPPQAIPAATAASTVTSPAQMMQELDRAFASQRKPAPWAQSFIGPY